MQVSESFYSIQGEGPTIGAPSYFVRLKGCNLICGGPKGKLMKQGKATWWCDTETVWRNGVDVSTEELLQRIRNEVPKQAAYHLIITGGEPMLLTHAVGITSLINTLRNEPFDSPVKPYRIEFETNGTLPITPAALDFADQFNVSPKLANSGMAEKYRITPFFTQYADDDRSYFKFVVSSMRDVEEVLESYVTPYDLPLHRVYLMPAADTRQAAESVGIKVAELAKDLGCRYSHRLHLTLWDQTTGV